MVSTVFQVLDQKKSRIFDDYAGSSSEGKKNVSKTECYVYIVVATIISFAVGIFVSYAVSTGTNVDPAKIKTERLKYAERFVRSTKLDIAERLLDEISADRIRGFLKNLTSTPKVAGTRINRLGAEMMQRMWLDHGLPNVKLNPYDVLLAYPNPRRPSSVTILSESGDIVFRTNVSVTTEEDLDLGRRLFPSFNAYSAAGKIKADLVYVNYGRPVDYALLRDRGIDVKGKLLLIRYGGAVRGTTVATAQRQGAAGVILYSDPIDFTVKKGKGVYPESVNLPPDGVQSGCIKEVSSDPLTPGYPATESAYRITIEQAKAESYISSILVYPIGYGDAQELLKRLDGSQVPDEWKGGLDLIYKTGPGLMNGSIVQLEVNDELKRKIITNVIGTIPGSVEPDRYVIIGNHRDSWTYGACDPSSGTACLVELTRAFGQMYKKGWRPKRTIIFCSWDGEEFGYVGSTEWVKEHRFILDRAVIYLNVDQAVTGNEAFYPRSIPGLSNIIYDIAKMVPNPNQDEANAGRTSVYDTWSLRRSKNSDHVPEVSLLRVGSDFYPFIHHHGIAAIDIRFADKSVSIPLYHTKYEVFDLEDKLLDKGFKYHRALSQIWAMLAISFSEQPVLPLNTTECGTAIEHHYKMLKHKYGDLVKKHNLSLEYVDIAVEELVKTSKRFEELKSQLEAEDSLNLRRINDQMLRLGRSMVSIIVDGKYHPGSRNVLYGTSLADPHLLFGQLVSAVNGLKKNPESKLHKESAKKQISVVIYHLRSASLVLKDIP